MSAKTRPSRRATGIGMRWIRCPECGIALDLFTQAHVEKHGMTKAEFIKKYPQFRTGEFWGDLPYRAIKETRE